MIDKLGLKDVPIERREDEALGLSSYADVLSEFVEGCDTPITIALQGDWGSGKTSLMNLIQQELDERGRFVTVWFNTWQYAQFNMSDTLALSMMSHFVDRIAPSGEGLAVTAARRLLSVARAVAIGGASVVGQGDTVKTVIDEAADGNQPPTQDAAKALEELKERLSQVVRGKVEEAGTSKVVVFIDDLDRLVPVKAVELLESLKLFLDIEHCVYILACDYQVVETGLKTKFGVDEGQLKGKSFFDKIIQVPFKMPTRHYRVEGYITTLLEKIGVPVLGRDVEIYQDLVEQSVGFNPRTMKRLFNSLLLLTILFDKESEDHSNSSPNGKRDRSRVLFGTLCLQEAYEPLYDHLRRQEISDDLFKQLIDALPTQNEAQKDDGLSELRAALKESAHRDVDLQEVSSFVQTFYKCIQLEDEGDDESLSETERRHLERMFRLSAVVSSSHGDTEVLPPAELVVELRRELNGRYSEYIGKGRPVIEKFRYSRSAESPQVYFYLPAGIGAYLVVWCGTDSLSFGVEAEYEADVDAADIARHLCASANWHDAVVNARENWCTLVEEPIGENAPEEAERRFRDELFQRLDSLMPRIYDICRAYHDS